MRPNLMFLTLLLPKTWKVGVVCGSLGNKLRFDLPSFCKQCTPSTLIGKELNPLTTQVQGKPVPIYINWKSNLLCTNLISNSYQLLHQAAGCTTTEKEEEKKTGYLTFFPCSKSMN